MDSFVDWSERDEISPFVQLLWDRGNAWEKEVIEGLEVPFLDLSSFALDEKEKLTSEAMQDREPLIYSCRISADDLLGDPDLLRLEGDGYVPIDIKSGRGEEGDMDEGDGKPKKHYSVQLGLYLDVLERKGIAGGRHSYVWDSHGDEVRYDFDSAYGVRSPRTPWQDYQEALTTARAIFSRQEQTLPAYSSVCKLCWWYSKCLKSMEASDDLTLVPELGRKARDSIVGTIDTVQELSEINPDGYVRGKKTVFPGVGPASLSKFHERAKLIKTKNAGPVLTSPVKLPSAELELFFDIEVDPMRDICYLHGFIERRNEDNTTESFVSFFANDPATDAEEQVFADAWAYIQSNPGAAVYYYSKYERTIYRKLQQKYSHVCSEDDIEAMFDPSHTIDLYYDVVQKATMWPTRDHSIKTLAKFLGFKWRDAHPSGAASIEWYARWSEERDPTVKQRILAYNEDDCRATRVLLDGVRSL